MVFRLPAFGVAETLIDDLRVLDSQVQDCPARGGDYVEAMEVSLTPDQETQLHQIASTSGCGADQLAQNVLGQFLEHEAGLRAAVLLGKEQVERGEGIPHAEIVARFEKRYGA